MKKYRVWIRLAVLCVIVGVPQLFWKPSRFGGIFLIALAVGCTGEWLMLRGREKYRACRVLARVGQVLFSLFVLTFALVQICIIGVHFEENDPAAAPKADYYLTLGALVNPDGQPSAALAARCDAAIGVMNANPASRAILCGGQGGDEPRTEAEAMRDYMTAHGADPARLILEDASSTTIENIANAKKLLPEGAAVAVITNDYHLARARRLLAHAGLGDDLHHYPVLGGPDLHGVMLHPPLPGVELGELLLRHAENVLLPVKEDGAGTGGALIQREKIGAHSEASF